MTLLTYVSILKSSSRCAILLFIATGITVVFGSASVKPALAAMENKSINLSVREDCYASIERVNAQSDVLVWDLYSDPVAEPISSAIADVELSARSISIPPISFLRLHEADSCSERGEKVIAELIKDGSNHTLVNHVFEKHDSYIAAFSDVVSCELERQGNSQEKINRTIEKMLSRFECDAAAPVVDVAKLKAAYVPSAAEAQNEMLSSASELGVNAAAIQDCPCSEMFLDAPMQHPPWQRDSLELFVQTGRCTIRNNRYSKQAGFAGVINVMTDAQQSSLKCAVTIGVHGREGGLSKGEMNSAFNQRSFEACVSVVESKAREWFRTGLNIDLTTRNSDGTFNVKDVQSETELRCL